TSGSARPDSAGCCSRRPSFRRFRAATAMRTISGSRRDRGRDGLVVAASIAALGSGAIVTGAIGVARAQAPPSPWQCLDAICERTRWLDDALGVELQSRRDGPVWIELDATTLANLTARPPLP